MAFEPIVSNTPTSIGGIEIILQNIPDEENPGEVLKKGYYRFVVLDQDGQQYSVATGNLLPHLPTDMALQISAFLDWCRTEAEGTLPTP